MGSISRNRSYAIGSPISDPNSISCTTFNILAPMYKRLNKEEFWVGNEELVDMYEMRLGNTGYMNFKLDRTNNRGDGLLTAVHKDYFRVLNHQELLFNDIGDRVTQLLHVELVAPFSQCRSNNVRQEILIVKPTYYFRMIQGLCLVRLNQVYKILQYVETYQKENKLNPLPVILCGDWNGTKEVIFSSSLDLRGKKGASFMEMWSSLFDSYALMKYLLRRASLTDNDAFAFLKADSQGDYITYAGFREALRQLNVIGHRHGLCVEETRELWVQADIDGNGVLDYKEFQHRIWNPTWSEKRDEVRNMAWEDDVENMDQTIGFSVKNAVLFPTEVEKGMWSEDYSLSDHARLTVVFSPVKNAMSFTDILTNPEAAGLMGMSISHSLILFGTLPLLLKQWNDYPTTQCFAVKRIGNRLQVPPATRWGEDICIKKGAMPNHSPLTHMGRVPEGTAKTPPWGAVCLVKAVVGEGTHPA
ncbi:calcium-binding endonuclease/exonuclease/phosphatase family [Actinidia rufa]|uniref:Calcium-binding endonuclease/exonuclease/phosphatase family n=1 Tax=Actinidia rufa TaxID=165716 RepID=A0A7J0EAN5_9ERIC|nr:calcium-binding endonuclease/exonuclease/phosphatase family [Actinidia rufa]